MDPSLWRPREGRGLAPGRGTERALPPPSPQPRALAGERRASVVNSEDHDTRWCHQPRQACTDHRAGADSSLSSRPGLDKPPLPGPHLLGPGRGTQGTQSQVLPTRNSRSSQPRQVRELTGGWGWPRGGRASVHLSCADSQEGDGIPDVGDAEH